MQPSILGTGFSAPSGTPDGSGFGAMLDDIESFGAPFVELSTFDNDLVIGGRIQRDNLARLKSACASRALRYSVHGPLAINFLDEVWRLPRHFDVFRASVEVAAELGAIHYVMHTGTIRMQQHAGIEAAYGRQREWFSRCGEIGREHGIYICVENIYDELTGASHTASPAQLAREIAAVDHPWLRATLDVGHAHLHTRFRGLDLISEIAALAPYAKHVHMHDNFGHADDMWMYTEGERLAFGHGDLHLPVGWGSIPWEDVLKACVFPDQTLFMIELKQRYWYAARACVESTKAIAARAQVK